MAEKKRFLHLVPDQKFIDEAREIFEEAASGEHDFLVIASDEPLRLIRRFSPHRVELHEAIRPSFRRALTRYEAVIVHFLNRKARVIVDLAPASVRFVWIGWGADYYHLISDAKELLEPDTRKLVSRSSLKRRVERIRNRANAVREWRSRAKNFPSAVANAFGWALLQRIGKGAPREPALLRRFSHFAPVLVEDYDAIRAKNPWFDAKFVPWNYPSPMHALLEAESPVVEGDDVLLGNSATPENNHADLIGLLRGSLGNRSIVCPLSYGDMDYGDAIAKMGSGAFGDRFLALREYMPAARYAELLRRCGFVAMNHVRQQGLGNVYAALWMGARVFLNAKSPVNGLMRRLGIEVFDVRALPEHLQGGFTPLSASALDDVRARLRHGFGRETLLEKTHALLREIGNQR